MFGKKKQNQKEDSLNFESDNYKMHDSYDADNLVVANLEYISNKRTLYGLMVEQTTQKYIFEIMEENGKTKYREIFTGFIADAGEVRHFNLPYVVNIVPLKEKVPSVVDVLSKYSLLLVLNEVNTKNLAELHSMDENDKLSDEEKVILSIFAKLLKETGLLSRNVEIFPKEYVEDRLIVEKKDSKWVSYINERGKVTDYSEFDDLYSLCLNAFDLIDIDSKNYCIDIFVPLVEDLINNEFKQKK